MSATRFSSPPPSLRTTAVAPRTRRRGGGAGTAAATGGAAHTAEAACAAAAAGRASSAGGGDLLQEGERKGLVEVDENEPKLRCMQGPRAARPRTKDHLIIDNESVECIQGHVYWS